MKKLSFIIAFTALLSILGGCKNWLDTDSRDGVMGDELLSTPDGIKMHMANLYSWLPIEDFNYTFQAFWAGIGNDSQNNGFAPAHFCDEAVHSEFNDWHPESPQYFEEGYKLIRSLNQVLQLLPDIELAENEKISLEAEVYTLRAYTYMVLAKRYGGVPLIEEPIDYDGTIVWVDRATEKETWDFILSECDKAIELFETIDDPDKPNKDTRRANKWIALAIKSNAALYAGSIARYTHPPYLTISGPAVTAKLVGIDASEADNYFDICLKASAEIINSGLYGLYKPNPASPEEAAANYQAMFEDPNSVVGDLQEPIFIKGYTFNTMMVQNYDYWYRPRQGGGAGFCSRMCPTLDLVDVYEDYTDDGKGQSALIQTRTDGNEDYEGYDPSAPYIKYPADDPSLIFANKDARMHATVIVPGSTWKTYKIIIQAGLIETDGNYLYLQDNAKDEEGDRGGSIGADGNTYFTFGAHNLNDYSGFNFHRGDYTSSGFILRKFLAEDKDREHAPFVGDTDWIEFRFAEILLNYAEAAAEKTNATALEASNGAQYLNAIRQRAAHTDNIPLTIDNVRKERFVELAFENKRRWDLIRWRVFHEEFNNRQRMGLTPILDLRENPVKLIYVRQQTTRQTPVTFPYGWYYRDIPNTATNGLVQNP